MFLKLNVFRIRFVLWYITEKSKILLKLSSKKFVYTKASDVWMCKNNILHLTDGIVLFIVGQCSVNLA